MKKKGFLWTIVIVTVGVLLVGGVSAFFYFSYQNKQKEEAANKASLVNESEKKKLNSPGFISPKTPVIVDTNTASESPSIENIDNDIDISNLKKGTIKYKNFPKCFASGLEFEGKKTEIEQSLLEVTTNCPVFFLKQYKNDTSKNIVSDDNRVLITTSSDITYQIFKQKPNFSFEDNYREDKFVYKKKFLTGDKLTVVISNELYEGELFQVRFCTQQLDSTCDKNNFITTGLIVQLPTGQWWITEKEKAETLVKSAKAVEIVQIEKRDDGRIILPMTGKPVLYLYPTKKQDVNVSLQFDGLLTDTYPTIDKNGSWNVTAFPDGTLINSKDNKQYSYIFWEGLTDKYQFDMTKGFVVSGADTATFLQDKLAQIGLIPREYNEMIVYWLPKLQHNKYNLIHFAFGEYTDHAKLNISPSPDSTLRVLMVYRPLENFKEGIAPQVFTPFVRRGFTIVEWGGVEWDR